MNEIEKIAYETHLDRGYQARASYLKKPNNGDALIEILKDGTILRSFLFPAYKIWNIAAHFNEIVDSEIANNLDGYEVVASTGLESLYARKTKTR